jgi:hypothetical protein
MSVLSPVTRLEIWVPNRLALDDRAIRVRSPAGAKDFSSNLCVQTGSEAHPASCTMGTGGPFPGTKRGRGVTLTTHPHLVPRSGMSRSYASSPPKSLRGCSGTANRLAGALIKMSQWTNWNQNSLSKLQSPQFERRNLRNSRLKG